MHVASVARWTAQRGCAVELLLQRNINAAFTPRSVERSYPMVSSSAKEVFIQGVTSDGKTFRPSDWAERLAGVLSSFRPGGAHPGSHLSYSPWCVPTTINGIKCVIVNSALREHEVMAWDFAISFARDNDLQVVEACLLPDPPVR